ncbi:MAG: hypothetical protein K2O35_00175 [Clostridia bacterium]|nr:hypothetical protein [Clostridia bacterium]
MKKYKAIDILWALSLIIIGVVTIILSVTSIANVTMQRALIVTFGVLEMIALTVLGFATARKVIEKKRNNNNGKDN